MRGINKVILIGNAGKDPEYKTLQDGTPVAKLAIATTETYRLKNGETQSRTDWHTIIAWRGLATFANQYIHKGSLLYIEGKLRNRQYEDKDGQKKYVTEVVADQVVLLDKKTKSLEDETNDISGDPMPF
jgi:single-strand DNA-binding protein